MASGVTFENTYCASPICGPSRVSMLTGCYPYQTGIWCNDQIFNSGIPTLAHSMGAAGYRPVLVGRMHAIGPDQLHGYAERLVGDYRPNFMGGRPADHGEFEGIQDPTRLSLQKSGAGQNAYQVHDEYVTAAAVDVLNRIGVERRSGLSRGPFSLTVGFMLPHQPYLPVRKTASCTRGGSACPQLRRLLRRSDILICLMKLMQSGGVDASWEDVAYSESCTYDGCQHRMIRQGKWKLRREMHFLHEKPTSYKAPDS